MTEQECLTILPPPGAVKAKKFGGGVIQILVTSSCNESCWHCTQGSQLRRPHWEMTPDNFEKAVLSLNGYHGVRGLFGGNPAICKHFFDYCDILRKHVPIEKCGIWCNHPITLEKAQAMRETFSPAVSNLNVHLRQDGYDLMKQGWPESMPFGLHQDSRHSPVFVAMKDLSDLPANPGKDKEWFTRMPNTEENRWKLISQCDIAHFWSAGIAQFRGEVRAWFCEIAMSQSILHQDDPDYPDTGIKINDPITPDINNWWWRQPMTTFAHQVRKHCHECSVPLRGYGELAMAVDPMDFSGQWTPKEQVSSTHEKFYRPKRNGRAVELVTTTDQLQCGKIEKTTTYLQNAAK